jgi:hypothetical protein
MLNENAVIVLNDHDTYTNIKGCHVVGIPAGDEPAVEPLMCYDLKQLLDDPAVLAVLPKYRVSSDSAVTSNLFDELTDEDEAE